MKMRATGREHHCSRTVGSREARSHIENPGEAMTIGVGTSSARDLPVQPKLGRER
jgi:hypothetical protein